MSPASMERLEKLAAKLADHAQAADRHAQDLNPDSQARAFARGRATAFQDASEFVLIALQSGESGNG